MLQERLHNETKIDMSNDIAFRIAQFNTHSFNTRIGHYILTITAPWGYNFTVMQGTKLNLYDLNYSPDKT